jgi:hypothetical protein
MTKLAKPIAKEEGFFTAGMLPQRNVIAGFGGAVDKQTPLANVLEIPT